MSANRGKQVPWSNLGGAPVVVEMDRIFLLACPNTEMQAPDEDIDQVPKHLSVCIP